jgi:rare lipoprotein A
MQRESFEAGTHARTRRTAGTTDSRATLPRATARGLALAMALVALSACQTMTKVGHAIAGIETPPPPPVGVSSILPPPAYASPGPAAAPGAAVLPPPAYAAPGQVPGAPVAALPPPAYASPPAAVALPPPAYASPGTAVALPPPAYAAGAAAPSAVLAADEAVPRVEPLHPTANRIYFMHGRTHWPISDDRPFDERGSASIYEARLIGKATASGESYDPASMSAAHPRLPIPSYARITNRANGQSVLVRINDRGPVRRDRVIDLSQAAADRIGLRDGGTVDIVRVTTAEILQLEAMRGAPAPVTVAAAPMPAPLAVPVPVQATTPVVAPVPPIPMPPGSVPIRVAAAPAVAAVPVVPNPPIPMPPGTATAAAPAAAVAAVAAPAAAVTPASTRPAPRPGATAATTAAARPAAARPQAAAPPSRWAVQLGAFAVEDNAQTLRERASRQLASGFDDVPASQRAPRIEKRGSRFVVLIGDLPDQASAEVLGERVRGTLRQNVVAVRR